MIFAAYRIEKTVSTKQQKSIEIKVATTIEKQNVRESDSTRGRCQEDGGSDKENV